MKNRCCALLPLLVFVCFMAEICQASESKMDALQYVGGTIPIIRKIEISGAGYADFFSTITADDYSAGFKASEDGLSTLTVTANDPWKVLVRGTSFTEVETRAKPVSDLLLRIKDKTVVHPGEGDGGTLSAVFSDFSPLSEESQVLWSNTESGDNGCTALIDFKVLLNAAKDKPGTYTSTITYTISAP